MPYTRVFKWHKSFKVGHVKVRTTLEEGGGRASTSRTELNVEWVRQLVQSNHWLTVRRITSELDIKKGTVQKITTQEFGMHYA